MIFSIAKDGCALSRFASTWVPRELDLEKFILGGQGAEEGILNASIFGEELLLISNQVRTAAKKRADLLAVDRSGNGVIIELKRDQATAGVETQALQYLAAFAAFQGHDFVRQFGHKPAQLEEQIKRFLGDVPFEAVNRRHRII